MTYKLIEEQTPDQLIIDIYSEDPSLSADVIWKGKKKRKVSALIYKRKNAFWIQTVIGSFHSTDTQHENWTYIRQLHVLGQKIPNKTVHFNYLPHYMDN